MSLTGLGFSGTLGALFMCNLSALVLFAVLVVYSALHPGSAEHGNWGNIIIIEHTHPQKRKRFFSLYGHLGKRLKEAGDRVICGEMIGVVGAGHTSENGWWRPHLHFAIYTGPWKGDVLPGYSKKGEKRTRMSYWKNPSEFIGKF